MKTRMMTMAVVAATAFGAYAQENVSTNKPSAGGIILSPAGQPGRERVPSGRTGENESDQGQRISISFDETPLVDIIKAFRDATGANIITTSATTNLQGKVSASLEDVPWKAGLTSILQQQNLALSEQPPNSGIYTIVSKQVQAIPKFTETFELLYAKADEVKKLFEGILEKEGTAASFSSANVVIVTSTEQKLKECKRILEAIDRAPPQIYIEARFAELSASAARQLGLKWDNLKEWGVGVGQTTLGYGNDRTRTSLKGGNGSSSHNWSETTSSSSGTEQNPNEGTSTTLKRAADLSSTISGNNTRSFDNALDYTRSRTFSSSLSADAFRLTLSAFEQMDGVQIFSNPKIIVSNERQALVDMTTKYPCVEVTSTRSGTDQNQLDITAKLTTIPGDKESSKNSPTADPFVGSAFFSYGISLSVTPRVSPNGLITVEIVPSISEVDSYYDVGISSGSGAEASPYSRYPIINMKRLITTFTMKSGTTAVIGGLSKTTETSVDSGIPGLRSIPWIGPHLFGWKSREKVQKEIVIFVTVGIADPQNIPDDIGMPKNAVLGRDILDGRILEPGDQTTEELLSLRERSKSSRRTKAEKSSAKSKPAVTPAAPAKAVEEKTPDQKAPANVTEKKPVPAPVAVKSAPVAVPAAPAKAVEEKTPDQKAPANVTEKKPAPAPVAVKSAPVAVPATPAKAVEEKAPEKKASANVTEKKPVPAPVAVKSAPAAVPADSHARPSVLNPVIPSEKNPVDAPLSPLLGE